ncbi:MAG: hypothetical protein OXG68_13595 [Chloroflexi bacterium]|nr:hypothetical protein [Chloroflexota bacterium]
MTTRVESTGRFENESRRLIRKFRSLRNELDSLKLQLRGGDRPGDRLAGIGYEAYKVRLPNRSARRGKSGGFRVIYQEKSGRLVLLLLVYSKTEYADIPDDVIIRVIEEAG